MEQLRYQTLEKIGYSGYLKKDAPEKVLQFGEGNFLRAFVDYFFDCANEKADFNGKVVVVQPIADGLTDMINSQEGLYTLLTRGLENGRKVDEQRVISVISRCLNPYTDFEKVLQVAVSPELELIVSNTTEAGIVYDSESKFVQTPPVSFPAKLTRILYERYQAGQKGVVILSCELIDRNGKELLRCVDRHIEDWKLGAGFYRWVHKENLFCSTLVDRIVPGRIQDEKEVFRLEKDYGYSDCLMDVGECFGIWIIEGPPELAEKLPFQKANLNVHVVDDVTPYKQRKVRILNGAHTGFVLGAYLAGKNIVRDCMENHTIRDFMNKMIYEEILPTLSLDQEELSEFAHSVEERFNNPFIDHQLLSISLNSTSKWQARNLPSLLAYIEKKGHLPECLTMSLAAYIAFYSNDIKGYSKGALVCKRPAGNEYAVCDDQWILDFYYAHRKDSEKALVEAILSNTQMWGQDLTSIKGLTEAVVADLKLIRTQGSLAAFASCLEKR